jgi:hypothetical protein
MPPLLLPLPASHLSPTGGGWQSLHGRRRWSSRNTTHRPPTLPVPCSLPHRPASRASSLPCHPLHYCTTSRPNRRRIHRQCDSAHLHYAELPLLDPPSHRRIDDGNLPYSLSLSLLRQRSGAQQRGGATKQAARSPASGSSSKRPLPTHAPSRFSHPHGADVRRLHPHHPQRQQTGGAGDDELVEVLGTPPEDFLGGAGSCSRTPWLRTTVVVPIAGVPPPPLFAGALLPSSPWMQRP